MLAGVPAEIELGAVAEEMLLGDVVIGTIDSALEQGEERFRGVAMDIVRLTAGILALAVLHHVMTAFEVSADARVAGKLVGEDCGLLGNKLADRPLQFFGGDAFHRAGDSVAAALHQDEHGRFLRPTATLVLDARSLARLATDIGFIDLDGPGQESLQRIFLHRVTEAVAHEPRALVALQIQGALELAGADALLAGAHEMQGEQPLLEADVGGVEDGADGGRELLAAAVAFEETGAMGLAVHLLALAAVAMRAFHAVRPADADEVAAGFFVGERGKLVEGHAKRLHTHLISAREIRVYDILALCPLLPAHLFGEGLDERENAAKNHDCSRKDSDGGCNAEHPIQIQVAAFATGCEWSKTKRYDAYPKCSDEEHREERRKDVGGGCFLLIVLIVCHLGRLDSQKENVRMTAHFQAPIAK